MRSHLKRAAIVALITSISSGSAMAHRTWLLPSATVLSGKDSWVTVDAAVSNDLFYFEHHPLQLDNLVVTAPDGTNVIAENLSKGRYRSTFDLKLVQPGTYRIAVVNKGVFASFKIDGQQRRVRSTAEKIAQEIPANATDVRISETHGRIETFVTSGKPSETALATTKSGLELVPVTHPNNLVAGEKAIFRLTLDGEPAANVDVEIVPGGIRYRDKLNDTKIKTDESGTATFVWPGPGMYWLNASVQDDKSGIKNARRRASYTTTVEVLPP